MVDYPHHLKETQLMPLGLYGMEVMYVGMDMTVWKAGSPSAEEEGRLGVELNSSRLVLARPGQTSVLEEGDLFFVDGVYGVINGSGLF